MPRARRPSERRQQYLTYLERCRASCVHPDLEVVDVVRALNLYEPPTEPEVAAMREAEAALAKALGAELLIAHPTDEDLRRSTVYAQYVRAQPAGEEQRRAESLVELVRSITSTAPPSAEQVAVLQHVERTLSYYHHGTSTAGAFGALGELGGGGAAVVGGGRQHAQLIVVPPPRVAPARMGIAPSSVVRRPCAGEGCEKGPGMAPAGN